MSEEIIDTIVEPTVEPVVAKPTINMEDLIAKARQDEKNKLYPEITKLKAELEQKTEKINQYLISIAEKDEEINLLKKDVGELTLRIEKAKEEGALEMGTEKDKTVKELETKLAEMEKQLQAKDEEFVSYKTQQEMSVYRAEKLKEVDETVADMVVGNTKEEIDASVEKAKAFYDKVASKFGGAKPPQEQQTPARPSLPRPAMEDLSGIFKNISPEDIMRMSSKEYAEYRKSIGLK